MIGVRERIRHARLEKDWTWLIPGYRSWDDPTWVWAIQIPLPFGYTIRFGKDGRA